jgi:hypothetical protein
MIRAGRVALPGKQERATVSVVLQSASASDAGF